MVRGHATLCIGDFICDGLKVDGAISFSHSDHQLVYTVRKATKCARGPSRNIKARSYRNFDVSECLDLNQIPWCTIEVADNPDMAWNIFEGLFVPICDKHAPFKNMKILINHLPGLMMIIFLLGETLILLSPELKNLNWPLTGMHTGQLEINLIIWLKNLRGIILRLQ